MSEINFVRTEVVHALNNIHEWMKPQKVIIYVFFMKWCLCRILNVWLSII